MNIGILGGSFDPIHMGHIKLAGVAKEQFSLDKILFIPAFIPPHKSSRRDLTAAPYRYRMVELAIKNFPGYEISHVELDRPDISYTVDTLSTLKHQSSPRDIYYLILGADSLEELPQWKNPEAILKMATLLVAPRPGSNKNPYPEHTQWIQMPFCLISSSEVRKVFERGEKVPQGFLNPEVENYIRRMGLYRKDYS
ncbi:MAG: nicotinate (nicotinamide) nucleotide adenylyltransferase [Candidatus Omnitrophica bacterium]|nr:nicotinate (nicotinamide) nucleotide adenylyltransferase [Candidatus Omnitrophota bacterium]